MRFQVCSDLHLELYSEEVANYLLVAGHICPVEHPNFQRFFDYVSPKFKEIVFVAGNQ
jgi:hypothetical protein